MTTETTTGTALEVLAPYLPYRIKLRIIDCEDYWGEPNHEDGDTLLVQTADFEGNSLLCKTPTGVTCLDTKLSEVLPILRPFSALIKPLADGTVPAVEVAKRLLNMPGYIYKCLYRTEEQTGGYAQVLVTAQIKGADDYYSFIIYEGWGSDALWTDEDGADLESGISTNPAWDHLRSLHFAVGLEPHQFIEKQD